MLLDITDDDRQAFRLYWELMESSRDALNDKLMVAIRKIPEFAELMKSLTPDVMAAQQKQSNELQRQALLENKWDAYLKSSREEGARYARMGIEFSAWFELLRVYRTAITPYLISHFKGDPDKITKAMQGADRFIDIAMATIGEAYLGAKQDIIGAQSKAIRELSTPVLQVKPRLLIVPLVGVIDTDRARQVTENVLHSIRMRRARAVVIDVTGVPVVDSKVANHLMQTVNAAGLMGAAVIVTGVSPEIAQTLVTIGAEMRGVRTAGDLEEGIEDADALLRARFATELEHGDDSLDGVGGGSAANGKGNGHNTAGAR